MIFFNAVQNIPIIALFQLSAILRLLQTSKPK